MNPAQLAPGITKVTPMQNLGRTPAMVNTLTGEVLVNAPLWNEMQPEHRFFVLLHELGHIRAATTDEIKADKWAFDQYAAAGYPLSESVLALSRNLTFSTPEHFERVRAAYDRAAHYDYHVNGNAAALGNGEWESFLCLTDKCRQRKNERKAKRQEEKTERVGLRQGGRSDRTDHRADAREVAYQYGIDPRGYIAQSVDSVANAAASVYGGGTAAPAGGWPPNPGQNQTLWLVLGALVLLALFYFFYIKTA